MTDSVLSTDAPASRWSQAALILVAVFATARLIGLAVSPVALYADETQYWVWSREFDWGYFSKPPMIAWLIALSTGLLGDSDFAVRLPAPLLHSGTAFFLFASARHLWDERTGFWAAATYLTLPSIWLSGFVMSTDALLLCAWSGGLYALLRLRDGAGMVTAAALGLAVGLGFLSKYAMIYFAAGLGLAVVLDPRTRGALLGHRGVVAAAIALACLIPNLVWNAANDFATVSHTAANANWGGDLFHPGEMISFLTDQLAVFGPALFVVLCVVLGLTLRHIRTADRDRVLLAVFTLPPLLTVTGQAFISRAHANWAASAYVAATLLVVAFLLRGPSWRRAVLIGSIAVHSAIGLFAAALAASPALVSAIGAEDATKRIRAWPETAAAIEAEANARDYAFIAFDDRNVFHQTQRYAPQLQDRLRMWMRYDHPANHAEDVWPLPEAVGGPVLIVSHRPLEVPRLSDDFASFEPVGTLAVPLDGGITRDFTLWRAEGHVRVPRDAAYEAHWQAVDAEIGVVRGYSEDG
ncbi:glycosyltransferase family 39 protein [Maricaulis sp.]|uniref:ArnT family glycosyltransferase n=1 Tax=Maricaulis sp. TaxID=1486257 RepID=UPI002623A34C|nr:glycosyltransferase family 39 protein [Maricaulis sp.]